MEKTLIILKPDCMNKKLAGTVLERLQRGGFQIAACKMMQLTDGLLKEHYSHIADKPFFPEIATFMKSHPVIILVLQGKNVIKRTRQKLGITDSSEAEAGSIRGDYGSDKMNNIAHASDSPEAAEAEIKRFFKTEEVYSA
jgi:nucleoside-diphosphate kinase